MHLRARYLQRKGRRSELTSQAGYVWHAFPPGFSAHWVRLAAHQACTATAQFFYT